MPKPLETPDTPPPDAAAPPSTPEHADGAQAQNTKEIPPVADTPKKPGLLGRMFGGRRTEKPKLSPQRLFFYADEHGHLDLQRTQPDTLAKLKVGISSTEVRQALGLVDKSGAAATTERPSVAAQLVTSVNLIAVQLAVNTWKLTEDQARLLVLHEDKAKDLHGRTVYQNVEQLTDDLMNKYFPEGFGDYDKEISLLLLLGTFTANAVQKIKAMKAADAPAAADDASRFARAS